jgi:hypothetical protein
MANDRYRCLVVEESLPEGTIAEHRKSRRAKAKRLVPTRRQRVSADQPAIQASARSRRSA